MAKTKSDKGGSGGKGASALDVSALAKLARIDLTPSEKTAFTRDLEGILAYVSELESVELPAGEFTIPTGALRNVLREDIDPYEPETFSKEILAEAPSVENGTVSVKSILEK